MKFKIGVYLGLKFQDIDTFVPKVRKVVLNSPTIKEVLTGILYRLHI